MTIEVTARARDLHKMLGPELVEDAYRKGRSLSAHLEYEDPSSEYKDGLDAFQRQLQEADITTVSLPEHGIWSDKGDKFTKTPQARTLFHEWAARQWRAVKMNKAAYSTRALFLSSDQPINSLQRPYADALDAYDNKRIAAAIPIERLVAMTTPIDGDAYRKFYITDDATNQRMVRVVEASEIPGAKVVGAEQTIRLYKYGRKLTTSYEQLRRIRINMLSRLIQKMAIQAEVDKLAAIVDVLVNGDGNTGTAGEVITMTTLGGTPGTLSLKPWLLFKRKFANPYKVDTILAREGVTVDLELLSTGSANVLLATLVSQGNFGQMEPINMTSDRVAYGWTDEAPASKIVGFDSDWAIEQVTEIGGSISEMERFITNQTEVMTLTEVEGYAVIDPEATKIFDIAT